MGRKINAQRTVNTKMITRIWHGWTSQQNAAAYQLLLEGEIFPAIVARKVAGYRGISLLKRDAGDEVEFTTIMWFDSISAVKAFAGEHYEIAVVPPQARALLSRFDERSAHHVILVPSSLACHHKEGFSFPSGNRHRA
jgi:antibiotic biosynthesis monooxygenase (ABM) superfamily enzyme